MYNVGETVCVAADFSNDGFEPFIGEVVEVDGNLHMIMDSEGAITPWMEGNIYPLSYYRKAHNEVKTMSKMW